MDFANRTCVVAEEQVHHPDLTVKWGTCGVEIYTHKINGLAEADFILAARIEKLCQDEEVKKNLATSSAASSTSS